MRSWLHMATVIRRSVASVPIIWSNFHRKPSTYVKVMLLPVQVALVMALALVVLAVMVVMVVSVVVD